MASPTACASEPAFTPSLVHRVISNFKVYALGTFYGQSRTRLRSTCKEALLLEAKSGNGLLDGAAGRSEEWSGHAPAYGMSKIGITIEDDSISAYSLLPLRSSRTCHPRLATRRILCSSSPARLRNAKRKTA